MKSIKEKSLSQTVLEDYYCIESDKNKLCIRNDLFVIFVFTKGSKWGEELFVHLFGNDNIKTNIYENLEVDDRYISFDIELEGEEYKNGIVVYTGNNSIEKFIQQRKNIELPIILRIFHTEVSLADIEKLGETSEFLLGKGEYFDVELILNGRVIGYGKLYKENEEDFKLKITNLIDF